MTEDRKNCSIALYEAENMMHMNWQPPLPGKRIKRNEKKMVCDQGLNAVDG